MNTAATSTTLSPAAQAASFKAQSALLFIVGGLAFTAVASVLFGILLIVDRSFVFFLEFIMPVIFAVCAVVLYLARARLVRGESNANLLVANKARAVGLALAVSVVLPVAGLIYYFFVGRIYYAALVLGGVTVMAAVACFVVVRELNLPETAPLAMYAAQMPGYGQQAPYGYAPVGTAPANYGSQPGGGYGNQPSGVHGGEFGYGAVAGAGYGYGYGQGAPAAGPIRDPTAAYSDAPNPAYAPTAPTAVYMPTAPAGQYEKL
eukprot:Unigene614_Nuclearia_a/m.1976 Unigene614_Nuclearia_a/g.1976  ORF Unigene614_Nuclearia_a/g.1976 Unigene614_Nuclearia_a/m.1976 type:complete len:262 (+) Unigene614_Nuclearia_a:142-927(+)